VPLPHTAPCRTGELRRLAGEQLDMQAKASVKVRQVCCWGED